MFFFLVIDFLPVFLVVQGENVSFERLLLCEFLLAHWTSMADFAVDGLDVLRDATFPEEGFAALGARVPLDVAVDSVEMRLQAASLGEHLTAFRTQVLVPTVVRGIQVLLQAAFPPKASVALRTFVADGLCMERGFVDLQAAFLGERFTAYGTGNPLLVAMDDVHVFPQA